VDRLILQRCLPDDDVEVAVDGSLGDEEESMSTESEDS
jgi:hypothetical protein